MEAYNVGDIIRWNVDSHTTGLPTYAKILDILNNKILLTYLHLKEPPDNKTDWDEGKGISNSWITDKNGYVPLDEIYKYSKLFLQCLQVTKCKCPTSQLMVKGCSCGGI